MGPLGLSGREGPWGTLGENGERGPKGEKGYIGLRVRNAAVNNCSTESELVSDYTVLSFSLFRIIL